MSREVSGSLAVIRGRASRASARNLRFALPGLEERPRCTKGVLRGLALGGTGPARGNGSAGGTDTHRVGQDSLLLTIVNTYSQNRSPPRLKLISGCSVSLWLCFNRRSSSPPPIISGEERERRGERERALSAERIGKAAPGQLANPSPPSLPLPSPRARSSNTTSFRVKGRLRRTTSKMLRTLNMAVRSRAVPAMRAARSHARPMSSIPKTPNAFAEFMYQNVL